MKKRRSDIATLVLTQGYSTIIDKEMEPIINQFKWFAHKYKKNVYAQKHCKVKNGKDVVLGMAYYIVGQPLYGKVVDHINGDSLDNRRSNLRVVTRQENSLNKSCHRNGNKSSIYPGVYKKNASSKWRVQGRCNGKRFHLGYFYSEEEAYKAYLKFMNKSNGI